MSDSSGPVRAVVFDLDGTLVNSMPMVLRAFAHAVEPFRPGFTAEELFHRLGGPPERIFLELTGDEAHVPAALARMAAYCEANWREIHPFEGAHGLLDELHERGRSLAVWTGRDRATTLRILAEHCPGGGFREIVCGDDLPTHKPHPQGLREIMDRLQVRPEETLYVGDADVDVLAGAAIDVRTILIRHDREVAADVVRKAWRVVEAPDGAYAAVRAALG